MRAPHVVIFFFITAALAACGGLGNIPEESPALRCSRCHGSVENPAPPAGIRGQTDRSDPAVGAHQVHVKGGEQSDGMDCGQCHVTPRNVDDPGHMDGGRAEVPFGGIAANRGATPRWDPATGTCSATYCHGRGTFTGGTLTTPQWNTVTPPQATCGSCHAIPPRDVPPHATVPAGDPTVCNRCHTGSIDPATGRVNVTTHVDGDVTLGDIGCTLCHGEEGVTPAPPRGAGGETATTELVVGAHRSHLADGAIRRAVPCAECHVVPTGIAHVQSTAGARAAATVTFGPIASARGATPSWDRAAATCAVYCHGGTLGRGGTDQSPQWTRVGAGEAACGTCHGIPPPPTSTTGGQPHPQNPACGGCHPGYTGTSVNLDLHVNGVADVGPLTCSSCHGTAGRTAFAPEAPPVATRGETTPTERGVGAHERHLAGGALRAGVACTECHEVPGRIPHANGAVDLAFGALARARGGTPRFDAAAGSCATVYCHGATLGRGGTNQTPVWNVPGSAACGTCHGIPPPPVGPTPHPQNPNCGGCHPGYSATTVNRATHVNGAPDVGGLACSSCHGTPGREDSAAPPTGTRGELARSTRAVGAHEPHLLAGGLGEVACTECHEVPSRIPHSNGAVDLAFGALARSRGAAPRYDAASASCSSVYCHGATLGRGGTNQTPTWTDPASAACGTCHGIPPPPTGTNPHPQATNCGGCHSGYTATTVNVADHVNGRTDVGAMSCTSCHGSPGREDEAAPPVNTRGESAPTARGVGAHLPHLLRGGLGEVACTECHEVPSRIPHANGAVDLAFGALARTRGAAPRFDPGSASCSSVYCHGATLNRGGTNQTPTWTNPASAACGTCHGIPPPLPHVQNNACGGCHTGYSTTTVNTATHVNGQTDVGAMSCTSCHGSPGREDEAAPPISVTGATAPSARGVGAHLPHLLRGGLGEVACTECHEVPSRIPHSNGTVDLAFGALARTRGAAPRFDPGSASCSSVYCHGATLNRGGTNQTPTWTNPASAACGTCHGIPPPATGTNPHPQATNCGGCHSGYTPTSVNVADHVNGRTDVGAMTCTSCHGTEGREDAAAPPVGTRGETAASARAVGAHLPHLQAGGLGAEVACTECHEVPGRIPHANGRVDIAFGALARTRGAAPSFSAAEPRCSSVYCHGAFPGGIASSPAWTAGSAATACGACHALPPGTGEHQMHVNEEGIGCGECHPSAAPTGRSISASQLHVNGRVDIGLRVPGTWEPASQSCNAGTSRCHDGDRESWRD